MGQIGIYISLSRFERMKENAELSQVTWQYRHSPPTFGSSDLFKKIHLMTDKWLHTSIKCLTL